MMKGVLFTARKVILVTTAQMHIATSATALVILPRTAQRKFPHQEHLVTTIDCAPTHMTIAAAEADPHLSITNTTKETASTGQDHTIDLNVTETAVTTGNIHPAFYTATAAAHETHPLADAVGDTPAGICHTVTAKTHQQPNTLYARATIATTPWTTASLAEGTLLILPTDHIHRRHLSHIYRQQPP